MNRRALVRGAVAVTTTLGIAASLCAMSVGISAAAGAADEVVIPDAGRFAPRDDRPAHASATGYAHREEGTAGYLWTDFASGGSRALAAADWAGHSGLTASAEAGKVTVTDLGTGGRTEVTVPEGQGWLKAYNADTVLTARYQDGVPAFFLQQAVGGTTAERAVTAPEGLTGPTRVLKQDSAGAVLGISGKPYLLDYESATIKPLPERFYAITQLFLGKDHILLSSPTGDRQYSVRRSDPSTETSTSVPRSTTPLGWRYAVVGDWIVLREDQAAYAAGGKLRAVPIGGGPARDLLAYAAPDMAAAPDGGLLVVGGTGAKDWALRRVTVAADGAPQVESVRTLPQVPATYHGLALGGGRLGYVSNTLGGGLNGLYEHDITAAGAGEARLRFRHPESFTPSGLRSLGDGETVAAMNGGPGSPIDLTTLRLPYLGTGYDIADAAGRYVIASNGSQQKIVDLDEHSSDPVLLSRGVTAASVWSGKLWKPAATSGTVDAYDLTTKKTSAPVNLNSGCVPAELQAVGRWLYWNCGPTGKAGVYDHTARKSIPVPSGEALLGDGFVVRHEGDKLRLTELSGGQTSDFADLPASGAVSGRHGTWTVDRFGGGVAYVDARSDIHVKRVPVAPQPLALTDATTDHRSGGNIAATWRTSRAVGTWSVEVRDAAGRTVRTFGGAAGKAAAVAVAWDGRDDRGRGFEDGTYSYVMNARPADGVGAAVRTTGTFQLSGSALTTLPGTYTPLAPARLMDTRSGLGGVPKARVGAGKTVSLKVTGAGGVPATGVTAVVMNVTAVKPSAGGFVSVYPSGTRRTSASNLNFTAGQTVPNLVVVPVVDGKVNFYNNSGAVDLLADVAGYYAEGTAGSSYQPVTPTRLMDTRSGVGVAKAKVGPGGTVTLPIAEPGAKAVVLNVTATNATSESYVSVAPGATGSSAASNLNFRAGQTVPNLVVVPVKDGKVTFYNRAGTVDLLADVAGYYVEGGAGARFTAMQPMRLLDTRTGLGAPAAKVGAKSTVALQVTGERIPEGVKAVVLNVTATAPTAASFVSVHPDGTPRTSASNLNFTAGQTVPNLVVVPVVNGKVAFYNHAGSVHLIADIAGYFTD
ncbi:FlgD immunoglobulin-like domain containing protein [Streptomyces sp. NPDC085481]|uniref:FlgD immunoglobulin-like domain containing protein n=1 Tax=Streptomyces sp. NPDC085481 TaxID=3365727 RepID=UPI0037D16B5F